MRGYPAGFRADQVLRVSPPNYHGLPAKISMLTELQSLEEGHDLLTIFSFEELILRIIKVVF